MTVRASVSFTDRNHDFARHLVRQGVFNSVSAVVAAGLQALQDRDEERALALDAMAEEIRRRTLTPRGEFTEFDGDALRRRLDERAVGRNQTDR